MFRLALAATLLLPTITFAQNSPPDEARLLRFPTIHGDTVVFSYAGNLYSVPAAGGVARRLTSHEGYEMFAHFSPDGKNIAFTGQYDGNTEVYVMPADGGVPKRLTFSATLGRDEVSDRMGPNNIVMGWKNNSEVLFRSRAKDWNDFVGQLYTVNLKGELPTQLPVPRGGFCSFSPDGKKLAFNRIFREFRTWKRYRGGMADDIWIYDLETKKTEAISQDPACDVFPMWAGDSIYFLSDRGDEKRFNLYAYHLPTKASKQLTFFKDYDIKYPSLGDKAIVFEQGGYLVKYDLANGQTPKIPVKIYEDRASSRPSLVDVSKSIASAEISPDGKRALFAARGDLFTVPAKEGPTRNLTGSSGAHDRNPKWSPDGKSIAYISDASGEDEIYLIPSDGNGPAVQITTGGPPYKYGIDWSPDSKKILWSDKKMRLFAVDVATKAVKQIAQSKVWEIRDYNWSPDSKWVAYARSEESGMPKVYIYSVEQDKSFPVTDGWFDSSKPVFSGDGKYLFFVSERDFNPLYSETEWNHAYVDMQKPYFVTLAKDTPSPFAPKSDETDGAKPEPKADPKDVKDKDKKTPPAMKVDVDGLVDRILALPVPAARYSGLSSVGSSPYYFRSSRKGAASGFYVYDLGTKKETDLGKITGYEISANGQKMLVQKDNQYAIIDLPKGPISISDSLNLGGMQVQLDRQKEWKQIFDESWRQMRDYFYDPAMHGNDWAATKKKYEVLLPHVAHRADLTYLIAEMISDLAAGHAYTGGGDLPKVTKVPMGLLGAELKQDERTKYYQIAKIYKGATWDKNLRSPLNEIGVDVGEGDFIIAVDGKPTNEMTNIYEALINTVGKQVRLKVNKEPAEKGSREIIVVPIGDEHPLIYHAWVQGNIKKVNDATKGEVGYVHIPDMLATGLNEFAKHYYPQLRKKALIIDVRGNGGGNVSPQIIERLRRDLAMISLSRDTVPHPNPNEIHLGPRVVLMNEYSASDGDLFPYRFRQAKLGTLIGKRSWGGVIGIRGSLPFVDGGSLNKPEFASYDTKGKEWIIENQGVTPDIIVDNDPATEYAGTDQQLNRAIEEVTRQLQQADPKLPSPPPFPKR